jgi:hypothetical protein
VAISQIASPVFQRGCNDILWPPVTETLQTGISIPCRRESIFWIPVFMGIIQRGLHRCRSWESLYGRLALDLAVLVGTGLPAVRGMHGQATGRDAGRYRKFGRCRSHKIPVATKSSAFSLLSSRIPIEAQPNIERPDRAWPIGTKLLFVIEISLGWLG